MWSGFTELNVFRIVDEPTAAVIAYGLDNSEGERHILVYDLGGGIFDVSLLLIEDYDYIFELPAIHIWDFDNRVIDHSVKLYKIKNKVDVSQDLKAMGKLKREFEKAKRTLSSQMSTQLNDLFRKTLKLVEQVLKDANIDKTDIVLGGSTRLSHVISPDYFDSSKSSN
ncbi:actin-like ATPase domain-containing protein [Rhizophagus irregularis]|uniref:Actin-like ATPase domain-containing protein n=1 Tax=Rhizophagus irregularis TaxID=588596 RepID=A0A2N0PIS6_9GLOM|nr:actin-like ATPase domain-containing protein [Rhizophagus irregularis]